MAGRSSAPSTPPAARRRRGGAAGPAPAATSRTRASPGASRTRLAAGEQDHVVGAPRDERPGAARQRQGGAGRGDLQLAPVRELDHIVVRLPCEGVEDDGRREMVGAGLGPGPGRLETDALLADHRVHRLTRSTRPRSITTTRSDRMSASAWSWVTKIIVVPSLS